MGRKPPGLFTGKGALMKRKLPLLIIPLALLVAVALVFQGHAPADVATVDPADGATVNAAGMMLYVDPDTGEFVEPTQGSFPVEVAYDDAYSTDDWGLVAEPAPKGGGTMMDLQGRFMNTFTATVDASGTVEAGCDIHKHVKLVDSEKEGE
jgi:hypothetical protein